MWIENEYPNNDVSNFSRSRRGCLKSKGALPSRSTRAFSVAASWNWNPSQSASDRKSATPRHAHRQALSHHIGLTFPGLGVTHNPLDYLESCWFYSTNQQLFRASRDWLECRHLESWHLDPNDRIISGGIRSTDLPLNNGRMGMVLFDTASEKKFIDAEARDQRFP